MPARAEVVSSEPITVRNQGPVVGGGGRWLAPGKLGEKKQGE